jgi:hypothetical protein
MRHADSLARDQAERSDLAEAAPILADADFVAMKGKNSVSVRQLMHRARQGNQIRDDRKETNSREV